MRKLKLLLPFLLGAALWPAAASAEVKVNFISPERYFDASYYGGYGTRRYERTLKELDKIFQELAARYLAPGDQLTIDVLNVDLAGEYSTWSVYSFDVRFMTEVTWPRIWMRYVLTSASAPPLSGAELVADQNYMSLSKFRSGSAGTMAYEKIMLERWFKARFASPRPTPAD